MSESSIPTTEPVQMVGRCRRLVCALREDGTRQELPCRLEHGHDGVCRYDTEPAGTPPASDGPRITKHLVPVTITCPAWCAEDPDFHAGELLDWDGACHHRSREVWVCDPTGYVRFPDPPRPMRPVQLVLASSRQPNGYPTESPVIIMDGRELTLEQADALAAALTRVTAAYRTGVAL